MPRTPAPPGRPLDLAYLAREGLVLQPWCNGCGTSGADLVPETLITRFGATLSLEAVTERLRCTRCGVRSAEIRVAVRNLKMGLRS